MDPDAASTPTPQTSERTSLPPEAIALASRLFTAARAGDLPIFEQALPASLSPNLTNDKGDTLIMLAAYHGRVDLVRLLLKHGGDPNRLNDRGQSPLAGTVFKGETECVAALLEGGADPELGSPSALESCRIFKQGELEGVFLEQVGRLRGVGERRKAEDVDGQGGGGGAVSTAGSGGKD